MDKEDAIVPGTKINLGIIEIFVIRKGKHPDTWVIKQFASGFGDPRASKRLDDESTVTEAKLLEIIAEASLDNMKTNRSRSAARMPEKRKPLSEITRAQFRLAHRRSLLV